MTIVEKLATNVKSIFIASTLSFAYRLSNLPTKLLSAAVWYLVVSHRLDQACFAQLECASPRINHIAKRF